MQVGRDSNIAVHLVVRCDGGYVPATQKDLCNPDFEPIMLITQDWMARPGDRPIIQTAMVYDSGELFMYYKDAITHEFIKEKVELIGNDHLKMIANAEEILKRFFENKQNV